MMNRIMKTGAVSVALAAATLLTPAAFAAPGKGKNNQPAANTQTAWTGSGVRIDVKRGHQGAGSYSGGYGRGKASHGQGHRGHGQSYGHGHGYGNHGFGKRISFQEKRSAVWACARAIQARTDHAFPGPYGRASFVRMPEVERGRRGAIKVSAPVKLEARRQYRIVPAQCRVRHGNVVDLEFRAHRARQDMLNQRYTSGGRHWGHR